ncbi:toxin ArtA [Escherichia coli]|nr:toxin ArtA [Escherichia coli]
MEKRSFKEKLEIIRNIIRESSLGNAAIIALIYAASHSLPINAFPDYLVISLLSIAAGIVVLWLFSIIYIYFVRYSEATGLRYGLSYGLQ